MTHFIHLSVVQYSQYADHNYNQKTISIFRSVSIVSVWVIQSIRKECRCVPHLPVLLVSRPFQYWTAFILMSPHLVYTAIFAKHPLGTMFHLMPMPSKSIVIAITTKTQQENPTQILLYYLERYITTIFELCITLNHGLVQT